MLTAKLTFVNLYEITIDQISDAKEMTPQPQKN